MKAGWPRGKPGLVADCRLPVAGCRLAVAASPALQSQAAGPDPQNALKENRNIFKSNRRIEKLFQTGIDPGVTPKEACRFSVFKALPIGDC